MINLQTLLESHLLPNHFFIIFHFLLISNFSSFFFIRFSTILNSLTPSILPNFRCFKLCLELFPKANFSFYIMFSLEFPYQAKILNHLKYKENHCFKLNNLKLFINCRNQLLNLTKLYLQGKLFLINFIYFFEK